MASTPQLILYQNAQISYPYKSSENVSHIQQILSTQNFNSEQQIIPFVTFQKEYYLRQCINIQNLTKMIELSNNQNQKLLSLFPLLPGCFDIIKRGSMPILSLNDFC